MFSTRSILYFGTLIRQIHHLRLVILTVVTAFVLPIVPASLICVNLLWPLVILIYLPGTVVQMDGADGLPNDHLRFKNNRYSNITRAAKAICKPHLYSIFSSCSSTQNIIACRCTNCREACLSDLKARYSASNYIASICNWRNEIIYLYIGICKVTGPICPYRPIVSPGIGTVIHGYTLDHVSGSNNDLQISGHTAGRVKN